MNICTVGYGFMGTWHSDALQELDCCLHTVAGRQTEPTGEFASRYVHLNSQDQAAVKRFQGITPLNKNCFRSRLDF